MTLESIIADLKARGLKYGEIAEKVGCADSTISMWANGDRAVRNGSYMIKLIKLHDAECKKRKAQERAA